jgi:SPP1 gp7 family putative phage head morphogenesis protein
LESGGTFADFQKLVDESGIELSESHLDNVFRTNIQNAYARGKWSHQQQNKDKRPYLEYMAINDSRVRPSHLALDGVIRHIDDPFWQKWYPTNGYRCRCTTNAITEKQAIRKGITPDDDLPDTGWSFQPSNYDKQPDEILKSKEASKTITPEAKTEVIDLRKKTVVDTETDQIIKTSLSDLTDEKQVIIDEMVDKAVRLDPNIRPSDLRITLDLADEKENALTTILKQAELQKDQDGTAGKSIWDKVIGAFNRLFTLAKNTANKLTGNSIRGIDGLNLTEGSGIGIQTPTLFKQAQKAGKQITILDAKGIAIDLNKISGLNGALLAPDLNLEVVSNTDDLLVLKRTDQKASRYFVANQTVISLY